MGSRKYATRTRKKPVVQRKTAEQLKWHVENRVALQTELFLLFEFQERCSGEGRTKDIYPVLGFLVGIGFSLWRAVFLATQTPSEAEAHPDSSLLLQLVIDTNAIAFAQEAATNEWMARYHNNNARLRLISLTRAAWSLKLLDPDSKGLRKLHKEWNPGDQEKWSGLTSREQWDKCFHAFKLACRLQRGWSQGNLATLVTPRPTA